MFRELIFGFIAGLIFWAGVVVALCIRDYRYFAGGTVIMFLIVLLAPKLEKLIFGESEEEILIAESLRKSK